MTVEDKKCPVFVDGEECGYPLIRVDLEAQKNSQIRLSVLPGLPTGSQHEYAAAREQIEALERATDKRYRKLKRSRKFVTVSAEQLRKMLE
jgi:hypothetical protein